MKYILRDNNKFILRFDQGEDVIEEIKNFAAENEITAAIFQGLGAAQEITIAFYDLKKKAYLDRSYKKHLEIISILGNIAVLKGEAVVHCHGIFSDKNMKTIAGHVKKAIVSATCEISLTGMNGSMGREYSDTTGLNLLT